MNDTTNTEHAFSRSRQAREAENTLDHITDRFDDNPQGMAYFYDLFRRVYCKGEEFKKHALRDIVDGRQAKRLHETAKKILRVEVEHRKRLAYIVRQYEKKTMSF